MPASLSSALAEPPRNAAAATLDGRMLTCPPLPNLPLQASAIEEEFCEEALAACRAFVGQAEAVLSGLKAGSKRAVEKLPKR